MAIIGAISKAVKAAKAVKPARAAKVGDTYYNARRRYRRSAERYVKKAEAASGATAEKYRTLARKDLEKALDTYDIKTTQDFAKPIRELANKLDIDLEQRRKNLKAMKPESAAKRRGTEAEVESASIKRLASSNLDAEKLRQAEARTVFSSDIGHRIIGGTVDIWRSEAVVGYEKLTEKPIIDKTKMMRALYDYFGVDNLADLLDKVEQTMGETLYREGEKDEMYETVKLVIQNKVKDNTLVA